MRLAAAFLGALLVGMTGLASAQEDVRVAPPRGAQIPGTRSQTDGPAPQWLQAAWSAYKARFIVDGRVVDNVNRITHSEGQGYAMLIAGRALDQAAFDQIWRWTKRELYLRPDGLAVWKWDEKAEPRTPDQNNATDGDLLIAWALVEAGERWQSAEYVDSARRIVASIGRKVIVRSAYGLLIMPAADGFTEAQQPDGPVINLSYWVFPAFEKLKGLSPEIDWADIQATGLNLIRSSRFSPVRLPPDWLAVGSGSPQPAKNFPARFSYNAIRIPLYLAWSKLDRPAHLRPFAGMWNEALDLGPFEIDLITGAALDRFGGAGFKAVASLVSCALEKRKLPPALRTVPIENYYPTTLHILSLLITQERYPECL